MISGISKKVIFFSFLFINFLQPSKSAEFEIINKNINKRNDQLNWSIIPDVEAPSNFHNKPFSNDLNDESDYVQTLKKTDSIFVAESANQQELIIQSDKQSEIDDVIYAEGNVSVAFKGKLLKADTLIYDKLNKKISAKGNISLEIGNQFFKAEQLEYGFISEKGY